MRLRTAWRAAVKETRSGSSPASAAAWLIRVRIA